MYNEIHSLKPVNLDPFVTGCMKAAQCLEGAEINFCDQMTAYNTKVRRECSCKSVQHAWMNTDSAISTTNFSDCLITCHSHSN